MLNRLQAMAMRQADPPPGTEQEERIKARLLELLDLAAELASNTNFLASNLQLLKAVVKPMQSTHAALLVKHLQRISSIVVNTDYSKEEYDAQLSVAILDIFNESKD